MRDIELARRAKSMRTNMPEPEKRLWFQLRAARFQAIKFRRQKVIGPYVADFAANEPKLVVELDGDTHAHQQGYDEKRAAYLSAQGYTVVRFTNHEVMTNMDGVLLRLQEVIETLRTAPLPTLSPKGERALNGAPFSLSPSGERVGERGT